MSLVPVSLRYALSLSGGIWYHLIARRRFDRTWPGFRASVRVWITDWFSNGIAESAAQSSLSELIVFGPSAGWTLPLKELSRFQKLIFVEPDPLARHLLRRRLIKAGVKSFEFNSRADLLPWFSSAPGEFAKFLDAHPSALILFSNVLGQVELHMSADQKARTKDARREFTDALRERRWASYHDLLSGSSRNSRPLKSALLAQILKSSPEGLAEAVFTEGDVIDHDTEWLSEKREMQIALWPITEKSLHVIGFVHSSRRENRGPEVSNEIK